MTGLKKAWFVLALAAVGPACQHHAGPAAAVEAASATAGPSGSLTSVGKQPDSRTLRKASPPPGTEAAPDAEPPVPVHLGKVLRTDIRSQPVVDSVEISRFFAAHNLASLLQTAEGKKSDYAMNGFRGANRYRTETVITDVRRQPRRPMAYQLRGLTRTRHRIQRFEGEIIFDSLSVEPMPTAQDKKDIDEWTMVRIVGPANVFPVKRYAVAGRVRLAEPKEAPDGAAFAGRFVMELELSNRGRLDISAPFLHGPSQGGGQKYAGTWTTYQTHQAVPTVWVEEIIGYSPAIFTDLIFGGRDVDINPKYAKLGWNKLWENDEWWAKSPKPKLSL